MSGICGIVALDGPQPDAAILTRATDRMAKRGPDGTTHWLGAQAALGHTALITTPEAAVERLPLVHSESGCAVVADIRLDNREDLAAKLGIDIAGRVVGDGELVLAAYLTWGDSCPEHFLGDFAFAIWDPRARRLFAARDQVGMKQLIYGRPGPGQLVFASDARAVRDVDPERYPLNEARIADYLEDFEEIDTQVTFFEGILRLPPAHRLTFDADGLRIERYWELTPGPELKLPSDEAYAAAFLEVFTEAIRVRLRSAGTVGSMLSGGMDSTSVAAVAAEIMAKEGRGPLQTFSAVGPDPETCPETRASQAAIAFIPGIEATQVDFTKLDGMVAELAAALDDLAEPFDGNMNLPRAIYLSASRFGAKVVLDGVAGDVIVGGGDAHQRFARRLQFGRIFRDARGELAFWNGFGPSPWRALMGAIWRGWIPEWVRRLRRLAMGADRGPQQPSRELVSPDLSVRVSLAKRRERYARAMVPSRPGHPPRRALRFEHPNVTVARERYDRAAARVGIEARDPFLDLRMIAFCAALPPEQIQDEGWPKLILRRAMDGLVPNPVRWRLGKTHLGGRFTETVAAGWPGWRDVNAARLALYARPSETFDRSTSGRMLATDEDERDMDLATLGRWLSDQTR